MPIIPALWEAEVGRQLEVRSSKPAQATRWNLISTKNTKISWAWCMSVVPATWEAEAWESLEPGRQRFQRAKIAPLYSSLDDRARLCLKKKVIKTVFHHILKLNTGQVQWLMPVISTLWEAKVGGSLKLRIQDHPGQHSETLTKKKNTKINWAWWQAPVVPATQVADTRIA